MPITGENFKSKTLVVEEIWNSRNVYFTDQPNMCILLTRTKFFLKKSKIFIKCDLLTKFEVNWSSQSIGIAKFVILTLVCKIHAPGRWPKNFTKFLFFTSKVLNWQNLVKKYLQDKKLAGGSPQKHVTFWWRHNDVMTSSCDDKILTDDVN